MEIEENRILTWKRFDLRDAPSVDGHCSCVVNDELYVFGGVVHTKHDFQETNTLAVASPTCQKFEVLNVMGEVPKSRSNATLAGVDKKLFLFGGINSECGWLDDLHAFNIESKSWEKLETVGPRPSPRDKIASAVVGSRIYFFGGFGPMNEIQVEKALRSGESSDEDDNEDSSDDDNDDQAAKFGWFNDLYTLDTATMTWSSIPLTSSFGPSPRAACSMCAVGRSLLVFGGRHKDGRCNGLFQFDTVPQSWVKVAPANGSIPQPRSFHAATSFGKSMVVVGGLSENDEHLAEVHVYNSEKSHWSEFRHKGGFTGRGNFTLNVLGDSLVAYGGSADFSKEHSQCGTFFNEFLVLPLEQLLEEKNG